LRVAQRRPEARPAIVLAAGDVGMLGGQRPALPGAEGAHRRLLRLQPEPAAPCSVVETRYSPTA
jgi:hypothetical protein